MDRIYLFVEGDDDERFFRRTIAPLLKEKNIHTEIIKYAQMKKQKVVQFISSIETLSFKYVFLADIDFVPTIREKKKLLKNKFDNLQGENIAVVITEIESWYLAGVSNDLAREFRIGIFDNTEMVTKEEFNLLYHNRFRSRIDFMTEILNNYSIACALQKNGSFRHFFDTFIKEKLLGNKK